ncbi:unnamed protein product [Strongylus vulgaris]|uniref:K Homology domain-containing protein n=1 Tax=Strongylus vulgaris TaxID=40348 RepID=A0A3P7JC05_STRVU|nr:unnamed protein product [Strongylus vulgaris]
MPAQQMAFIPQNPLFIPPDTPPATHPNAGFYLIPASGGWMPPMIPGMPPNPFIPQPLINPEAVLMRQRSLKKPNQTKSLQLRHEMIIRNSDSGKIMGVKGRRVALVEQMTNTVISFQKAAQEALSEYLRARAKPSAEEREKRKERRKSMPLQASHQEQATAKKGILLWEIAA